MIDVRLNGQSLALILTSPPKVTDQLQAVCRTMEVTVQKGSSLVNYLGQSIELWDDDKRKFVGSLRTRSFNADGAITYTAYDPLYFFAKNPDDWYFKNMTATQGFKTLAEASGVRVKSLANTGVVFPYLYYPGAEPDKVGIDLIARTYDGSKRKYWYRYAPDYGTEGLVLFERKVPTLLWAFQVGVNLTSASYDESIEDAITIVKLVNRDTGKTVTKINQKYLKAFGPTKQFEEVDKDAAPNMDRKAQEMLDKLCNIAVNMQAEGINTGVMPQLFSGDVVYVEEKNTGLIGAYHILNITQTYESSQLIQIGMDLQLAPDIPTIQYEDAAKKPEVKATKETSDDTGVQEVYGAEMRKVLDRYAL
jgi:hypothetical protein